MALAHSGDDHARLILGTFSLALIVLLHFASCISWSAYLVPLYGNANELGRSLRVSSRVSIGLCKHLLASRRLNDEGGPLRHKVFAVHLDLTRPVQFVRVALLILFQVTRKRRQIVRPRVEVLLDGYLAIG